MWNGDRLPEGSTEATSLFHIFYYVDGVSKTYSIPRKTYGIGVNEVGPSNICPCAYLFVHKHYCCESGSYNIPSSWSVLLTIHPVWDGEGCHDKTSCFSEANLPWFITNQWQDP